LRSNRPSRRPRCPVRAQNEDSAAIIGVSISISIGYEAPDFTLQDQHGQDVTLSEFRGRRAVLLVFYPFAFSGICSRELSVLRDEMDTFDNDEGSALLAVSCDPMYALRVFSERDRLHYPLLSDFWPHGDVSRSYGIFDQDRGCALRGTFLIDTSGVVRWQIEKGLPNARDVGAYRAALAELAARAGRENLHQQSGPASSATPT